jgi:hypothetical protein
VDAVLAVPPGWRLEGHEGAQRLVPIAAGPLAPADVDVQFLPLCPLRSLAELIAEHRARGVFTARRIGASEPLVTDEGERATLASALGELGGRAARRTLAVILVDDHAAVLVATLLLDDAASVAAVTAAAALDDALRRVVRGTCFGLGLRPRRVEYTPPPGWKIRADGPRDDLVPADAAVHPALISVWPAVPLRAALPGDAEADDFTPDAGDESPAPLAFRRLSGCCWQHEGRLAGGGRELRRYAILQDPRYVYRFRLRASLDDRLPMRVVTFDALVPTVAPIPEPAARPTARGELFSIWTD